MRITDQTYVRQQQTVEELRGCLANMERISDLIFRLPVIYAGAWQDMTAAKRSVRHALYLLDDSGMSEHIMDKHFGL